MKRSTTASDQSTTVWLIPLKNKAKRDYTACLQPEAENEQSCENQGGLPGRFSCQDNPEAKAQSLPCFIGDCRGESRPQTTTSCSTYKMDQSQLSCCCSLHKCLSTMQSTGHALAESLSCLALPATLLPAIPRASIPHVSRSGIAFAKEAPEV